MLDTVLGFAIEDRQFWYLSLRASQFKGNEIGFHFLVFILTVIAVLWVIKGLDFCSNVDINISLSLFLFLPIHYSIIWISIPTLPLITLIFFFLPIRDSPTLSETKRSRHKVLFAQLRTFLNTHSYPEKEEGEKALHSTTDLSQKKEGLI